MFASTALPRSRYAPLVIALAALTLAGVAQSQGLVGEQSKISSTRGNFAGVLTNRDSFGSALTYLGDHDGDGVGDLAVGAFHDDDGGDGRGAVWILFLDSDDTVGSHQKISDTAGGFGGSLDDYDSFGYSVASLGDLDGDGVGDLAVGGVNDADDGPARGAVWILFLEPDGTVRSHQEISDGVGGLNGVLDNDEAFGSSLASLGDLDGDGVGDLAVGAFLDDDGGTERGAVWMLFLNANGTVKSHQKISDLDGAFTGVLDDHDGFGRAVASLGDLNGDNRIELAVGAIGDDDGGPGRGAVWILFLQTDGTVRFHEKISQTDGLFTGALDDQDLFGWSIAAPGDLDSDGVQDLVVGAIGDDDGGTGRGSIWTLFLNNEGEVRSHLKVSGTQGGFNGALDDADRFGCSVATLGPASGGGAVDLVVGAFDDDDGGLNRGGVWELFVRTAGTANNPGSGTNPQVFLPGAIPPSVGAVWRPLLSNLDDLRGGSALFGFAGGSKSRRIINLTGRGSFDGELLINLDAGEVVFLIGELPQVPFTVPIPLNVALIGEPLYTQASVLLDTGAMVLTNGLDVVIGL